MNRYMKGSIVVLALLMVALIVSLQGTLSAKATKTTGTTITDINGEVIKEGIIFVDEGGNTHVQGQVASGNLLLIIDSDPPIEIEGTQHVEITGAQDENGNGPFSGAFTYFDGEGTAIMEGHYKGKNVNFHFSGNGTARGIGGPIAGMKFKATFEEIDDTGEFIGDWVVLDPHGDE